MKAGRKLLESQHNGEKIVIRYLDKGDSHSLMNYINELSREKTYIRYQGEQTSFEEEVSYIESQLKKIMNGTCVVLLLFVNDVLSGVTNLNMRDKTESHVGLLGISISKHQRGKGLGKLLMNTVIEEAVASIPELRLITLAVYDINDIGRKLYTNLGFVEYGMLPEGIHYKDNYINEILMYKKVR